MEISLLGGPKAGEFIQVASAPDAIEFPIYAANGGCSETCRYERINKTLKYEFQGRHSTRQPIEAPPEKAVVVKRPKVKVKETSPKHGKMQWSEKHGRYILVSDSPKE
jgi:hypothetical protein